MRNQLAVRGFQGRGSIVGKRENGGKPRGKPVSKIRFILSRHSFRRLQGIAEVGSEKGHCVIDEWSVDEPQGSSLRSNPLSAKRDRKSRDSHNGDLVAGALVLREYPKAERRKTETSATFNMTHCGSCVAHQPHASALRSCKVQWACYRVVSFFRPSRVSRFMIILFPCQSPKPPSLQLLTSSTITARFNCIRFLVCVRFSSFILSPDARPLRFQQLSALLPLV